MVCRVNTCVSTAVVVSRSDQTWFVTSKASIRQFQRLTVHCVEKGVRDLSIWRCTCERALVLLFVPPVQLIWVGQQMFQFADLNSQFGQNEKCLEVQSQCTL